MEGILKKQFSSELAQLEKNLEGNRQNTVSSLVFVLWIPEGGYMIKGKILSAPPE